MTVHKTSPEMTMTDCFDPRRFDFIKACVRELGVERQEFGSFQKPSCVVKMIIDMKKIALLDRSRAIKRDDKVQSTSSCTNLLTIL